MTQPSSDSEAQSSGRVTGEQADGSELRAEYEARLAVVAEQAEQVGSTAFGTNLNCLWHKQQHWSPRQSFGFMLWT